VTVRRGPRPVGERLRRLLVILPWLMERGRASLTEMAERFQVSEPELLKDLELVAMCGLPPYLDECIDLFIDDDGTAQVDIPRFFRRPLRLTTPEGFALLAAGRAALELPGADPDGPLARALAKLEAVLGADGMVLDLDPPPATAELTAALQANESVAITYWSASSDELSERTIVPRAVFSDRGRWYVTADAGRSGQTRHFRIDRIRTCERTGERVDPAEHVDRRVDGPIGDRWFADNPELPTVRLRLDPAARWVAERFPVRSREEDGDALVVELVVASERWLRQLLLRVGPHAEVITPERWTELAADAARDLLAARYAAAG
jgi:proteasome accessory factor C